MPILTLRTDKPEAEIGLYEGEKRLAYVAWLADRQLAETLHTKVREMLSAHDCDWSDLGGIVVYEGPGSFTGLRIGISVANALAYSLSIPIMGAGREDENWIVHGVNLLEQGKDHGYVTPFYGAEVHTTPQKK